MNISIIGDEKCNYLIKENLGFLFRKYDKFANISPIKENESLTNISEKIVDNKANILIFHHLESNREPVQLLEEIINEFPALRILAMAEYGNIKDDFNEIFRNFNEDLFRRAVTPLFPDELYIIIQYIFQTEAEKNVKSNLLYLLRKLSKFIDNRDTFSSNKRLERHVPLVQRLVSHINKNFLNKKFNNDMLQIYSLSHDISRLTSLRDFSIDEIELVPENFDKIAEGLFHLDSVETNSGHYYQSCKERNVFSEKALTSAVDLYTNLRFKTSARDKWSHEDSIDCIKNDVTVLPVPEILNSLIKLKLILN